MPFCGRRDSNWGHLSSNFCIASQHGHWVKFGFITLCRLYIGSLKMIFRYLIRKTIEGQSQNKKPLHFTVIPQITQLCPTLLGQVARKVRSSCCGFLSFATVDPSPQNHSFYKSTMLSGLCYGLMLGGFYVCCQNFSWTVPNWTTIKKPYMKRWNNILRFDFKIFGSTHLDDLAKKLSICFDVQPAQV